ncbi:hypothetical protein RRG08_001159 [Elysia crispata]|uniref:Uncharacterized protein n=1 Tax=Elysia crispata TaxID=231223 RepID=A0AAE1DSW7_9GAST|nr:hypothetical protein RRG08_001159 [Elysia crispata]
MIVSNSFGMAAPRTEPNLSEMEATEPSGWKDTLYEGLQDRIQNFPTSLLVLAPAIILMSMSPSSPSRPKHFPSKRGDMEFSARDSALGGWEKHLFSPGFALSMTHSRTSPNKAYR